MTAMISFCGLCCDECPAFIATKTNDDNKRKETAQIWSKQFNADIKPESVNCEGCLADTGVLFHHCKVCQIRKCGKEKGVVNCGYCKDYPCDKLTEIFRMAPEAKKRLDEGRRRRD